MNTSQIKQLGSTVGFVIAGNRPAVIRALKKHGVAVNDSASDSLVRSLTIDKIFNDQRFNNDFDKLSKQTARSFLQATRGSVESSADGSFDWGGLAGGILGAGTSIFGQINATNAAKKLAEQEAKTAQLNAQTAIQQANAQIEIEKLRLAQLQAQKSQGGGNTLMYVGIGLAGIIVVGGLIFAIRKK